PLHVELFREGTPTLGRSLLRELARTIELSLRIGVSRVDHDLAAFRERFRERWESAEVPLMVALDDDLGVGFHADPAPPRAPATRRHDRLIRGALRAEAAGAHVWSLDEEDLVELEADHVTSPADSVCLWAMIASRSAAALAKGDFKLWQFPAWYGGATMLGRFCHEHGPLRDAVARHLAAEASLRPDTIFPEVVYAPPNRAQNVVARPTLRGFELPIFTRGSAPPRMTLDLADLFVSVRGNRVRLRSERWGKWVAPRMTHAHSVGKQGIPLLRFLAALQADDLPMLPEWSWDPIYRAPHLPRVEHGRLVLALERWNLSAGEIAGLAREDRRSSCSALQALREERRLPRFVTLVEGTDQSLIVDFDNVLSCESFLDRVRGTSHVVLCELFPGVDELPSHGPDGSYVAELVVPYGSKCSRSPIEPVPPPIHGQRSFAVGSEWLYAKIYVSRGRSDALLTDVLGPCLQRARDAGEIDDWFFIRYADPLPHLRVRCHGSPDALLGRVLPALRRALEPALVAGEVERF
ncbi:MAG: lantibiotic dehydratase, partial [Myxococcales bacterium]|nr:lantibiotic dehydratase [Myxococcales bacterium]